MRNPVHVRDVLKSTDRSMSHLETLGGGAFDVLRQMCEDINRPKEDKEYQASIAATKAPAATKKAKAKDTEAHNEGGEGAEGEGEGENEGEDHQAVGPELPDWVGGYDTNAMASMMQ